MDNKSLSNISIILVRPEFTGNIGSTARVMKNFGLTDLRLVNPPKNYRDSEARMMAVGAHLLLKTAMVRDSLSEALTDVNLSIALSSGRRRSRQLDNLAEVAPEIVNLAEANRIAFVFGNERNGLLDDELALCSRKVRIESSIEFPALNLAQAVGIVAYSLASSLHLHTEQPSEKKNIPELPSLGDVAALQEQFELLVDNVDFSRSFNRDLVISQLKDAYDRMVPTKRELSLLKGILYRLNAKLQESSKTSLPSPTE